MAPKKNQHRGWSGHPAFHPLILAALLAATVLILFAPSLRSGFAYDSVGQILIGDYIHQPGNLLDVLSFRVIGLDVLDFNRPVALASLMFDSLAWGRNPFGYHLSNILLHLLGTGLAFVLARHILAAGNANLDPARTNLGAFLAALIFAAHPLATEAVCEPSNRKDLLAMVFGFTALLLLTRPLPSSSRGNILRLFLVALLSLLAVGSKEVGAAFPAIIFLYWFLFRRQEPRGFWFGAIAASALPVIAFSIARFSLAHRKSEIFLVPATYPDGTFASVFPVQPRIYVLYLLQIVWPSNLCADYSGYSVRFISLGLALAVLAVVAAILARWALKDRRAFFAIGIMAAGILPASNLLPMYHPAADRYLYIPLVGIGLLIATGLEHFRLFRRPARRWIPLLALLVLVGAWIPLTLQREWVWSSPLTFWQDTLARNPHSFNAIIYLPKSLLDAGRLPEAREGYEAALQTPSRNWPWLWAGYAIVLQRMGEPEKAARAAQKAIALKPDILDTDKMVRTMQVDRSFSEEFDRLVASRHSNEN